MNVQNINNINFQAIPIASVRIKGLDKTYKLYEITRRDKEFLDQFYNNLNLKGLMHGLKEGEYDTWNGIIKRSIESANKGGRRTIMETCEDVPCGFLNYSTFANKLHLNYVATIPIEKNERVPFAGQILFNEFFKRLLDSCADVIELSALRKSPFSPILKYLKLGFKPMGGSNYAERMKIYRNDIQKVVEKQDEFIDYQMIEDKEVFFGDKKQTDGFLNSLVSYLSRII